MKNYKNEFLDIVRWANLAPSSHNCQPWSVKEVGVNQWLVKINQDRSLKGLKSHKAEMLISLGAFIVILENLLISSDIPYELAVFVGSEKEHDGTHLIELGSPHTTQRIQSIGRDELIALLKQRATDRGLHKKIKDTFYLEGALLNLTTYNDISISSYEDLNYKNTISQIIEDLGWKEFTHIRSWKELYSFIDFKQVNGLVDKLGFNIQQLVGPSNGMRRMIYAIVLNPSIMPISHFFGLTSYICKKLIACIHSSHAIVVISTKDEPTTNTYIAAGRRLADVWLSLTQQNLVLHPLSILLQHEDLEKRTRSTLPNGEIPLFIARIGLPVTQPSRDKLIRYRKSIDKGVIVSV